MGYSHSHSPSSPQNEAIDRRERLRKLALETIDLAKDPYFMRNHLGRRVWPLLSRPPLFFVLSCVCRAAPAVKGFYPNTLLADARLAPCRSPPSRCLCSPRCSAATSASCASLSTPTREITWPTRRRANPPLHPSSYMALPRGASPPHARRLFFPSSSSSTSTGQATSAEPRQACCEGGRRCPGSTCSREALRDGEQLPSLSRPHWGELWCLFFQGRSRAFVCRHLEGL